MANAVTLTWRRTWPEVSHDFTASEGDVTVGRIRRTSRNPTTREGVDHLWNWTCTGIHNHGAPGGPWSGAEEGKQAAVDALAEAWERAKRLSIETGKPISTNPRVYTAADLADPKTKTPAAE